MTTYGFRLFSAELIKQAGRKAHDYSGCDGEHYIDLAERLLATLRRTAIGKPKLRDSIPDESSNSDDTSENHFGQKAFQVTRISRTLGIIEGTAFVGTVGQHKRALGVPGVSNDSDISSSAASREHRFILALPEKGTLGVVAMESIGRSCPVDLLRDWLARASQMEAAERNTRQKQAGESSKRVPWWKLRLRQMTDEQHLQELIESGKLARIELSKKQILPDRKREEEKLHLTSPRIEGSLAQEVGRVIGDWFARFRSRDLAETVAAMDTEKQGAQQLAAIIGDGVENIDFDDGWIVVNDQAGEKRVSPSRMPELFTYFIDWSPPSDADFYRQVRDRAALLSRSAEIDVNWPSIEDQE